MFDVFITVAEKDFNKLRFVIESVNRNVPNFRNIFCVAEKEVPVLYRSVGVHYFTDDEVINLDFDKIDLIYRRGWYKQQFIKLFQDITLDDYLVVDADAYVNKPLIIDTANPVFYFGRDQNHAPYFQLMKALFDLDRVYKFSFINEIMLFKRPIINEILELVNLNKHGFFLLCANMINKIGDASGFSEYELYGNFTMKYHPDLYGTRHLKTLQSKKHRKWTEAEIAEQVKNYTRSEFELFTMHTWA